MKNNYEEAVAEFESIEELTKWLDEQINDGEQISKGKSPTEKSKVEKAAAAPEGGEEMMDPAVGMVPGPGEIPGAQIVIGNKEIKDEEDPEAVEIKVSGKKEKVETKPQVDLQQNM